MTAGRVIAITGGLASSSKDAENYRSFADLRAPLRAVAAMNSSGTLAIDFILGEDQAASSLLSDIAQRVDVTDRGYLA